MGSRQPVKSFLWIYGVALAAILVVFIVGISLLHSGTDDPGVIAGAALLCASVLGLIITLSSLPIALSHHADREASRHHEEHLSKLLTERLQNLSVLMTLISEQQLISERGKSVAFREKDLDAARRAVQEEMTRKNWEAALALAGEIDTSFGHKEEADGLRGEINVKRDEIQRLQLAGLIGPVDRYIQAEAWGSALQEAQQIMANYPNDPQVQRLPEEIESRRQMRKQQLRLSWEEAVNRHDVDGSIEILKRLDLYLTPAEAESMQELARNMFREKRETLRTRFALAVQEHDWTLAIQLGDEIMRDFPNTRIAQEVREKMEALRKRSEEPETASSA
jgi:hypothetical protein